MTCSETDSFVDYLTNEHIEKKLFSEADLTFTTALYIAVAMETVARDASELQSKHGPSDSQIKQLYVKNKSDRYGGTPGKFASKGGKPCFWCNGDHIP